MSDDKAIKSFDELWEAVREALPDSLDMNGQAGEAVASTEEYRNPSLPGPVESSRMPEAEQGAREDARVAPGSMPNGTTSSDAQEDLPVPLDVSARTCLSDIRKYASWSGPDGKRQMLSVLEIFNGKYPGHQAEAEEAVSQGRRERDLFNQAYKLGAQGKPESSLNGLVQAECVAKAGFVHREMLRQFKMGQAAARKRFDERERKRRGGGLSVVRPRQQVIPPTVLPAFPLIRRPPPDGGKVLLHANDVRTLAPAPHWVILVDEGGQAFDELAASAPKQRLGRFVGLAIRADENELYPLYKGWHAVDCSIEQIDRAMQSILDAPVGVMGIDVRSVPATPGERWLDGVALLIDWFLRLLPLTGPTKIEVLIEQRGIFCAGQSWDVVRRGCLRALALAFPAQALKIDLDIRLIRKDDHPFNGYVDALAYTWAQTNDSSKERIRRSGLAGTCLLNSSSGADARAMLNAWDAFAQGVHLPADVWWNMLCSPDATNPASLLAHLLTLVGKEARANVQVWQPYLNEVKARMAASPIELRRMSASIDWLQNHKPADADILSTLRLVWLTVQLARANHMGETEQKWQAELIELGIRLFDEAAPLVCHADLHLAVAATNRYDFESAGRLLLRWQSVPPAVPGLRYWAHMRSSMGQHAAFLGDNAGAVALFREAMGALGRLSDPEARRGDQHQTGCYLTIALMDETSAADLEVRKALEYVTGNLPEAAFRLSGSELPSDRYAHHLLLRWLTNRGDADVQKAYLDRRVEWKIGDGHPWPLIQLYRGVLLRATDPAGALALALDGAQRAFDANQGPTVRLIGACCRAVAAGWGNPWPGGEEELNSLKVQLPLAANRIEKVRASLHMSIVPQELLAVVLPFNFR